MGLFKQDPVEDFDTPAQLAQELDSHRRRYEAGRQNVLDRGTAKVQQLTELETQTRKEREDHEALLKAA